MECKFHVGQKVVCIETWENEDDDNHGEIGPVAGQIYTIRSISVEEGYYGDFEVCLRLNEIRNGIHDYYMFDGREVKEEPAFRHTRFKPLVEKKTDISIFKAMLNPVKQKELT